MVENTIECDSATPKIDFYHLKNNKDIPLLWSKSKYSDDSVRNIKKF